MPSYKFWTNCQLVAVAAAATVSLCVYFCFACVLLLPYRNRRRRCRVVVILLQYINFFTIVAYLFHSDFHIYHFTDFIFLPLSLCFFYLKFLRICIASSKFKRMRKSKNQNTHTHSLIQTHSKSTEKTEWKDPFLKSISHTLRSLNLLAKINKYVSV